MPRLCRLTVCLFLLCVIAIDCSARKVLLNKPYPYTKYSTITFLKGDSCVIKDFESTAYFNWKYHHDTIVVDSRYKKLEIQHTRSEIVNKDMDKLIFHINTTSHLPVINILDDHYTEIKNVVPAFSNEVKHEHRFKYFTVSMHKGVSVPQPLASVKKGAIINVFIDYPSLPEKYPYDLHEKFMMSGKKLEKVR
ncbi:MAG: hypothetical protein EOP56_12010 [Sphingobacteriales bacterium]|nr:MAG: hypothetical protein EOP56_12010 [Sphingobacteriales bacterium]